MSNTCKTDRFRSRCFQYEYWIFWLPYFKKCGEDNDYEFQMPYIFVLYFYGYVSLIERETYP